MVISPMDLMGANRSTVVAGWAAGQQVKRSILHQGHGSSQKAQYSLTSAESWPKIPIIFNFQTQKDVTVLKALVVK